MDLAIGAKDVFVMMELQTREGQSKLVQACTYPLTGVRCVSRVHRRGGVRHPRRRRHRDRPVRRRHARRAAAPDRPAAEVRELNPGRANAPAPLSTPRRRAARPGSAMPGPQPGESIMLFMVQMQVNLPSTCRPSAPTSSRPTKGPGAAVAARRQVEEPVARGRPLRQRQHLRRGKQRRAAHPAGLAAAVPVHGHPGDGAGASSSAI